MTTKEISFAENYLCTFNATEAAKAAGYSERSARQIGYENLTKPYIQE
ncbi:terminase small subunit [Algoriphagus persicinus]|nr:terminase small subunit [Algoriphagus sp. E1-3-M2]MEB2784875.1 terminase small subunit [Algoriphagus sp. E1-3-M2]